MIFIDQVVRHAVHVAVGFSRLVDSGHLDRLADHHGDRLLVRQGGALDTHVGFVAPIICRIIFYLLPRVHKSYLRHCSANAKLQYELEAVLFAA